MRRKLIIATILLLSGLVAWGVFAANRARRDRVSLSLDGAALAEVIRAIERQTWETVLVATGATRNISIHVERLPLSRTLEVIATQAECEWTKVLVLHREGTSLAALKGRMIDGTGAGWTNYTGTLRRPGFTPASQETGMEGVTYSAKSKPARQVTRDLSWFGKVVVVLEDGIDQAVTIEARDEDLERVVEELARSLGLKCSRFYLLRPFFRSEERASMPLPQMHTRALPDEVRKAFQSGERVQIRFSPEAGGPGMELLLPLEDLVRMPDQNPEQDQRMLQQKAVEEIRNSTPEQRLERLRNMQRGP